MRKLIYIIFVFSLIFLSITVTYASEQLWRFITGGRVRSQPVVGKDGTVYIISEDRFIYAINPDGEERWRCYTDGRVTECFIMGNDGTLYLGLKNGRLLAINQAGRILWKTNVGESLMHAPAVRSDGTIYIVSEAGTIYAISHTGDLRWQYSTGIPPFAAISVDADGTLYVPLSDKRLLAVYPWGTVKWCLKLFGNPVQPVIDSDGTIYVGADNGDFYAIEPAAKLRWVISFNAEVLSPVIADEVIYGTLRTGEVFALDKKGNLLWTTRVGSRIINSCALGMSGTIYVTSEDRYVHAVDRGGGILWSLPVEGGLSSPVLSQQEVLYAGSKDWTLYALRAEKSLPSAWPQCGHDVRHTSNSPRKIYSPSIEELYANNPDFLYLKTLILSKDASQIEKGIDEIQKRYDDKNMRDSTPYVVYLLGRFIGYGVTESFQKQQYPVGGFSQLRERACVLYTDISGIDSQNLLIQILLYDDDNFMKAITAFCLGLLQSDPEGRSVGAMTKMLVQMDGTKQDDRYAFEVIQALRRIWLYHGYLPYEGIKALLAIAKGSYINRVKEMAFEVLTEMSSYR